MGLYFQMKGGQQLDEVSRKTTVQARIGSNCNPLPQDDVQNIEELVVAIRDLNRAIALNPMNSQAYLQLGRSYCLMGDPEKAKHNFLQYSELRPKNPLGYLGLGFAGETLGDQKLAYEAWLDAGISSENFLEVGRQAREDKQYEEALEWNERAIKLSPEAGINWYEIGLIYEDMGRSEMALEAFQKSLESPISTNPGIGSVYYQIGRIYQSNSNETILLKARTAFEKAIENGEFINQWEKADSHYRLGLLLKQMGEEPEKFISELKTTTDIYPNHVNAHIALGEVYYFHLKDLRIAEQEFFVALEIDPKNKWAYYKLGEIYLSDRNYLKAEEMYKKALDIDPEFKQPLNRLSKLPGIQN